MIVLINPNSTVSMTQAMLQTARETAPNASFEGWTSHQGPPSIQGEADGLLATPPLLDLVKKASDAGATAIVIGCFDDTALDQACALARCPVIGIGQAAYKMATRNGARFSVVTTLAVSVPILEENIQKYGLTTQLGKVRASGVPVLAIEQDAQASAAKILAEIKSAEREDNIQSVVLGCGGMVEIERLAASQASVKLIDGVRSAALMASAL